MKEAIQVLKKIESYGYEAYLVGGAPRNHYLNLPILDYDICTNAKPEELKQIFPDANLMYAKYGSVRVIENGILFEITTYRKDLSYENHRKPEVQFVKTLEEDLQRRDFVINTLCLDSSLCYVDYLNARGDLDKKVIRTVKDPNIEFEEDALRILRAIRFAVTLKFSLDDHLKFAIQKNKKYLKSLSDERKKEELEKIFSTKDGSSMILKLGIGEELGLSNLEVKEKELSFYLQKERNTQSK